MSVTFELSLIFTLVSLSALDKPFRISEDLSESGKTLSPLSTFSFIPWFLKKFIVSSLVNVYNALYKKCGLPGI